MRSDLSFNNRNIIEAVTGAVRADGIWHKCTCGVTT